MLDAVREMDHDQAWSSVGVHPTPFSLVDEFARVVCEALSGKIKGKSQHMLRVLDACSGDGRLGHAVALRLSDFGAPVELTCVEVNPDVANRIVLTAAYSVRVVTANFLLVKSSELFDVVVSNPPYEAIGNAQAGRYQIPWKDVAAGGRNLYGLAIRKCLDVCVAGGVVGLIAPHGWLRNARFRDLRDYVSKQVDDICIYAYPTRNMFDSVTQETSLQVLKKSKILNKLGAVESLKATIMYGGEHARVVPPAVVGARKSEHPLKVRVGPLVWNRTTAKLRASSRGAVLVVNGGNIGADGKFRLGGRYAARQYVSPAQVPEAFISTGPMMLIKRTLRGGPGDWSLDYVHVSSRTFKCVAENHVLVVSFPRDMKSPLRNGLVKLVAKFALEEHLDHGHPNISAGLLRFAVQRAVNVITEASVDEHKAG